LGPGDTTPSCAVRIELAVQITERRWILRAQSILQSGLRVCRMSTKKTTILIRFRTCRRLRLQACKTARGLQPKKAQRSPNLKRQREFLDSYSGLVPENVGSIARVVGGRKNRRVAQTAALPRFSRLCCAGGRTRTEASESLPCRKALVGVRNSKFRQSGWKIYLKRTV
jgi:hypothetical protein